LENTQKTPRSIVATENSHAVTRQAEDHLPTIRLYLGSDWHLRRRKPEHDAQTKLHERHWNRATRNPWFFHFPNNKLVDEDADSWK
jgi:hypothetical protein